MNRRTRPELRRWYARASRCRLGPMVKTAQMLTRHLERLVTWFEHPITNAFAEGFNSVIQGLKTAARGFRSFANYRIRILFRYGKLDMASVTQPPTSHYSRGRVFC
ncbi:MAG: transposase [Maioricimonas sp. JB049]